MRKNEIDLKLYKLLDEAHAVDDTRYYGVFIDKKHGRCKIKIDVKRYCKKIGLSEAQLKIVKNRKTHYFMPTKQEFNDYNCNQLVSFVNEIRLEWNKRYALIIEDIMDSVQLKKSIPADDDLFLCGVLDYDEAAAVSAMHNFRIEKQEQRIKTELYMSLHAQFFHQMVSKIEALTYAVLIKNGFNRKEFKRGDLYKFKGNKFSEVQKLRGFDSYEKMYLIWNFIKHNSVKSFEALKSKYSQVFLQTNNKIIYRDGDPAYQYIAFSKEMVDDMLSGVGEFFKKYCQLTFGEDYQRAQWDYEKYFLDKAKGEIETITNPLSIPNGI